MKLAKKSLLCLLFFCSGIIWANPLPKAGLSSLVMPNKPFIITNLDMDPLLKGINIKKFKGQVNIESSVDEKIHISFETYGNHCIKVLVEPHPKRRNRWVIHSKNLLKSSKVKITCKQVLVANINGQTFINGQAQNSITMTIRIPDQYKHLIYTKPAL